MYASRGCFTRDERRVAEGSRRAVENAAGVSHSMCARGVRTAPATRATPRLEHIVFDSASAEPTDCVRVGFERFFTHVEASRTRET